MAEYFENFTLTDIFNNKKLKGKLPLINYKEKETEDGKTSKRTSLKTVNRLVYDTALSTARPFYKEIHSHRGGGIMEISGEMVDDENGQDNCVEAVYNSMLGIKTVINWTANNAYIIRDALKEGEKKKFKGGTTPKLFLRAVSMEQIEGMSKQQRIAFMTNIMENIYFNDAFSETQKKWGLENKMLGGKTYAEAKALWQKRVGLL